jgi:hypothetical protein
MANVLGGRQTVPLEEVVLAQALQLEALMNVLERQGVIKKAEVLEEIKQLKKGRPQGQSFAFGCKSSLGFLFTSGAPGDPLPMTHSQISG